MKLLSLIISIISIIQLVNATGIDNYINLIPYKDNKCTRGNDYGIGYSAILNSCVSFDGVGTSLFTSDGVNVSYAQNYNDLMICGGGSFPVINTYVGQCIDASYFSNLDLNRTIAPSTSYLKVELSSEPIILPGSYVMSYSESCSTGSGGGSGNGDKIITVEYVTKGTLVKTHRNSCNGDVFRYTCNSNGQPAITSVNNVCPKLNSHGETCIEFIPFKNETANSPGSESLSGSNSCLDSGSGGAGLGCEDTGSGSGSGSGNNKSFNMKLNGGFKSPHHSSSTSLSSGTSTGISGSIASSGFPELTGGSNSNSNNNNGYGNSNSGDAPLIYISTYCS